ncbi:MAG: DUF3703 domain-containing protein [Polaribacter sp.]|uniref:DUF3703 domain-containing protein n=1 Tax=Polaribacter sp. TaxID=1920175 RepID=UPI003BB224DF
MNHQELKTEYYHQLNLGKEALKNNNFEISFYHLENAHVLGQKHILRHTISHYWMLVFGIKKKSIKEVLGQIVRIVASLLFTFIWVPKGNTGGTNVSPIKILPMRNELKKYF